MSAVHGPMPFTATSARWASAGGMCARWSSASDPVGLTAALCAVLPLTDILVTVLLADATSIVQRVRGGWTATGEPWAYDGDRYARVAEARGREQQAMRDYISTDGCRMAFLRAELDDVLRRLGVTQLLVGGCTTSVGSPACS